MGDFASRKITRKAKRLTNMLYKDSQIENSEEPTKILFIGNAGLTTGLKQEILKLQCMQFGLVEDVIMVHGKSYCFVVFEDLDACSNAFNNLQGKRIPGYPHVLYLAFVKSVPMDEKKNWGTGPPGAIVLEDVISVEDEERLLRCSDRDLVASCENLKHRSVVHYGYEFLYHNNNIKKIESKIPSECAVLFDCLRDEGYISNYPDQLTINRYLPGQGIPSHIDTHSAFEDTILSLSLGSPIVMDFKHSDGRTVSLLLPQRSVLIMTGEARYAWSHGITPRKIDEIPCEKSGFSVLNRGTRTSFTFRWIRSDYCKCQFPEVCDSFLTKYNTVDKNDKQAAQLEQIHVHNVYENIAAHFSETRHKPWPNVLEFVQSFPKGSLLIDIGCGNGKYFGHNKNLYEIGCDSSTNLSLVCREREFEVFTCDCLAIPIKDNSADACISIAVIHHLASQKRRLKALREIIRVLRSGGKALIYVWAKDQTHGDKKSFYLKKNQRKLQNQLDTSSITLGNKSVENAPFPENSESSALPLPLHTNRTQFVQQDLLVPWKLKPQSQKQSAAEVKTFYRYYHVFEESEFKDMCLAQKEVDIVKYYYDQGNWCVVIKKK